MRIIHIDEESCFETIEINDIPALYTACRIDRYSLPIGFYAYDIREGDNDEHSTIEKTVFANHAATIITLVPIVMTEGDYTLVKDINFISQTNNYEFWRDEIFKEMAESGEWKDRAIKFLQAHTQAHIDNIIDFVNEHWQILRADKENLQEFYNFIITTFDTNNIPAFYLDYWWRNTDIYLKKNIMDDFMPIYDGLDDTISSTNMYWYNLGEDEKREIWSEYGNF